MKIGYWLPEYQKFLQRLILARKEAKLTQRKVAKKLKKPQSFISKCEKGERRVDALELHRFSVIYGKNLYYFFGKKEEIDFSENQLDFSNIIQKAHEVFHKYGQNTIPINLELIAERTGIIIDQKKLEENVSAILYLNENETPKIIINQQDHLNRQRFSIAHEMGHFFLKHDLNTHTYKKTIFFRNKGNQDHNQTLEIEANRFAAELLIPSVFLEKELSSYDGFDEEELISKLVKKFKVSTIAMQLRLQDYFK